MLQGKNIQIYQITSKNSSSYNSIEFTLNKDVPFLKTTANKLILANESPFSNYKVGDHLGIDVDRTSLRFPTVQGKIWKDSAVVAKLVNDPSPPSHKTVYNSEEFGDG
jgi:hypothetical protein